MTLTTKFYSIFYKEKIKYKNYTIYKNLPNKNKKVNQINPTIWLTYVIYILLKIMIIHKNYLYKLYFTTFLIKKINQMRKLSGGLNVYSKFGFRSIVFYDCIKFYSKKKMGRKQEKIMEIEKKK